MQEPLTGLIYGKVFPSPIFRQIQDDKNKLFSKYFVRSLQERRRCVNGHVIIKCRNMINEICKSLLFLDKIPDGSYPLVSCCRGNHVEMAGETYTILLKMLFLMPNRDINFKI